MSQGFTRDHVDESRIDLSDVTTDDANTTRHGFESKATAPAAGTVNYLGIENGETERSDKALFDATNPANLGTAAPGTSLIAAHRDHVHNLPSADGWVSAGETWTYASATTFTVSGDVTVKYFAGVKLRYKQGGAYLYATVVSSSYSAPNTTVTIFFPTGSTLSNAAITDNYYSYELWPQGWTALPGGLLPFGVYTGISPFAAAGYPYGVTIPRNIYFVRWDQSVQVLTTNNGSNYWTIAIYTQPGNTLVASTDTSALTVGVTSLLSITSFNLNPALIANDNQLYMYVSKTGAPGNLYIVGPALHYL